MRGARSPDSIEKMKALSVCSDKLGLFLAKENLLNRCLTIRQIDNPSARSSRGGASYTKFADAVMEIRMGKELIDVLTSSDEFHFEIADEDKDTRITLFSVDLPTGRGTFDLQVVDSYGQGTYQEQGEWRND